MNSQDTRRGKVFWISVGVGTCVFFGAFFLWYHYYYRSGESMNHFDSLIIQTKRLIHDNQCANAATTAQQAVSLAPTHSALALAQYTLAKAVFCRGQGKDQQNALSLIKQIALDTAAPADVRADAYNWLGGSYYDILGVSSTTLSATVFTTPPFSDYLAQAGGDVAKAELTLFEESNRIYATAFANYQMAVLHSILLHREGMDPANAAQKQTALEMQSEVTAGDALVARTAVPPDQFWLLYVPRAVAVGAASYYIPTMSTSTIKSAYDKAIAALGQAKANPLLTQQRVFMLYISYTFALAAQGDANDAEIKRVLNTLTFKVGRYPQVDREMQYILHRPPTDVSLVQLRKIANLSSDLKSYLGQLGS